MNHNECKDIKCHATNLALEYLTDFKPLCNKLPNLNWYIISCHIPFSAIKEIPF